MFSKSRGSNVIRSRRGEHAWTAIRLVNASSEREIEEAFAIIAERGPAAVIVTSDPFFFRQREQLVALAARYAVPMAYNSATLPGLEAC